MMTKYRVFRIVFCLFLTVCIFQAVFYPFLLAPNTEIAWWQFGVLAGIGYISNLPVFLLGESIAREYRSIFFVIGSMSWIGLIYYLMGLFVKKPE